MDYQHLVLEFSENESAADVQLRLDKAAADGFFLVNVIGRLAFMRTTKKSEPTAAVVDDTPVNADALTVLSKALASRSRITLRDLRRIARFDAFPEKEWYRALESLVESGRIVLREEITAGGHKRTVVLAKAKCPS